MNKFEREELIHLCLDSVVPCEKWADIHSYIAQLNISDIFTLLNAGCEYTTIVENDMIHIHFNNFTKEEQKRFTFFRLSIDELEDCEHLRDVVESSIEYEGVTDKFDGYLPTRNVLNRDEPWC